MSGAASEPGLTDCFKFHKQSFQNDRTHKVSDFKARGFMFATECVHIWR